MHGLRLDPINIYKRVVQKCQQQYIIRQKGYMAPLENMLKFVIHFRGISQVFWDLHSLQVS